MAVSWETPGAKLPCHLGFWVSSGQCIHVGQDQIPSAVSTKLGLVFPLHDWERAQHVISVIAPEAVKVEIQSVEAGAQVSALLLIPSERRAIVPQVSSEGRHIIGSVSESEHMVTDEVAGRRIAELPSVVSGWNHRELLYYEPIEVLPLYLLSGCEVQGKRVETSRQKPQVLLVGDNIICVGHQGRQGIPNR